MEEQFEEGFDIERKAQRDQRIRAMRRRKEQQDIARKRLKVILPAAGIFILAAIIIGRSIGKKTEPEMEEAAQQEEGAATEAGTGGMADAGNSEGAAAGNDGTQDTAAGGEAAMAGTAGEEAQGAGNALYSAHETGDTMQLDGSIVSNYAIFIDMDSGSIVAEKNAKVRMNPASMTKVLTLLVAVEHLDDLEETVTITQEMTDYSFVNGCSNAGFEKNEAVTVRDLLYGTILPSGAEAAMGLAIHVAGSQEAFVEMMNGKLEELGLSESAHFTNCVGVYDEDHYCTAYDMAMIMEAAVENELCRQVLSAKTYTTSETEEHPEGMILSNWFLRRIEDKDVGDHVFSGKTGYVEQSGSCAASYGEDSNGKRYVCVTADADNQWKCINDHAELYRRVIM